jgi:hypothetical protein
MSFYWFNVSKYSNVLKDSKKVKFPVDQQFVLGFIDGNHSPEYVVNDFYLVWKHLVPGGMLSSMIMVMTYQKLQKQLTDLLKSI